MPNCRYQATWQCGNHSGEITRLINGMNCKSVDRTMIRDDISGTIPKEVWDEVARQKGSCTIQITAMDDVPTKEELKLSPEL